MVRFAHCDPKVCGLRFHSDGTGLSFADFVHDFFHEITSPGRVDVEKWQE